MFLWRYRALQTETKVKGFNPGSQHGLNTLKVLDPEGRTEPLDSALCSIFISLHSGNTTRENTFVISSGLIVQGHIAVPCASSL